MKEFNKFIGLDVHKETLSVSVADAEALGGELRFIGVILNTEEALAKLVKQLSKGNANVKLHFCYEAGCCGFVIQRYLSKLGQDCQVIAPSLIPKKAGDRVKTDRRDSLMLARLHRAGELTPIWIPDGAHEALRDLVRAREDMKHLQKQAKQRLSAFLLRHGMHYLGKCNWTLTHFRWLETVKCSHAVQQIVMQEYIDTIHDMTKRVNSLDVQIELAARASPTWKVIEALMALRGINLLTATTIMAEIGDLRRFMNAAQLMKFLGLVPSEHSSGSSQRRGHITKAGNSHVRRVLIESAWTYRFAARKTAVLQRRAERTTQAVQEIAWKGQVRLCGRYQQLLGRGKLKVQVCTAVARELAGFIWAIGQAVPMNKQDVTQITG
jgi:transposase